MQEQFQNQFLNEFSFLQGKKIFLAVSGGLDSMVLLRLFEKLAIEFAVLHCNFQLRESESDADEAFVSNYCSNRSITFFSKKFDTKEFASINKLSIQVAARELRYDWFYEQLTSSNYDYVTTAHHLDDSLETFIINFTRGTGLNGLVGIPVQNEKVIRPLLTFSRNQIMDFAIANAVAWREDASNKTTKYLRNKIRHELIPILKEVQPELLSNFQTTIHHLQQSQSIISDAVHHFKKNVITEKKDVIYFDCDKMMQFSNYQNYLYQILSNYGFSAWFDVNNLVTAQSGKQVFSDNYVLLKDRNQLILHPQIKGESEIFYIQKENEIVKFPLNLTFCNIDNILNTSSNCIFVDEDKLKFPLIIRKWTVGDLFFPFGMKGTKKVSKFFKDEKISILDKNNTWILCSDNQIVWIIGMRMDDRFKVTNETRTILKITLNK